MKFARYLEENEQPEWARAYIQYRALKKLIKRVDARRKARIARATTLSRQSSTTSTRSVVPTLGSSARSISEGLRRRIHNAGSFAASRGSAQEGSHAGPSHSGAASATPDDGAAAADWHGDTAAEAGPSRISTPEPGSPGSAKQAPAKGIRFASLMQLAKRSGEQERDDDEEDLDGSLSDSDLPPVSLAGTGLTINPNVTTIRLRPPLTKGAAPARLSARTHPSSAAVSAESDATQQHSLGGSSAAAAEPPSPAAPMSRTGSSTAAHGGSTGGDSDETKYEAGALARQSSKGKAREGSEGTQVRTTDGDVSLAAHSEGEAQASRSSSPDGSRTGLTAAAAATHSEAHKDPAVAMAAGASEAGGHEKSKKERKKELKMLRKASKQSQTYKSLVEENFDLQERKFFAVLDTELARIVAFYEEREAEYAARFELIALQLKELADHRRQFKAREEEDRSRFGAYAGSAITKLNMLMPAAVGHGSGDSKRQSFGGQSGGAVAQQGSPHLAPMVSAPAAPQPRAVRDIESGVRDEGDARRSAALARIPAEVAARIRGDDERSRKENAAAALSQDPERYKQARKKLKTAVLELYRAMEILKNYSILNRTGFAKILKKAEKTWEVPIADPYFQARVAPSPLVTSQRVELLLKSTEELFVAYFEHGDRKRALSRLRVSVTGYAAQHPSHHLSVFKAGLFLGVGLCAGIAGLVLALHVDAPRRIPQTYSLLRLWAALFIPSNFALLFGVNLAFWHRARINTAFIFEWDVRHAMDYHQFYQIPSLFLLLFGVFFWLCFLDPFPGAIAPTSWPLVYLVTVVAFMLNPFPIFLIESRKWFVRSILRVFTGGMWPSSGYSVQFRDFFLGDELNSLTFSLSNLWFLGCEYNTKWAVPSRCSPNQTYWTAALLAIPATLRFLQCLRRWYDSKYTQYIHLVNAGKYSTVALQYWLYVHWRMGPSRHSLALWVTFAVIYSTYTSAWDILMDWSLLRLKAKKPFLRDELCFEDYWPWYYFAMVSNVVIRFGWVIYLYPGPASTLTRTFLYALLESLRRWQWNFFRVENEHLGNADSYRIVRDVPLPYTFKRREDAEEDTDHAPQGSGLRLSTLRNRRGDASKRPGERDSSEERQRTLGESIASKVEGISNAHRSMPQARDYAPRRGETPAITVEDGDSSS